MLQVSTATLENNDQVKSLQEVLRQCLPYSLPIYRRIQFHLAQPVLPAAQIFISAALPASSPIDQSRLSSSLRTPANNDNISNTSYPWLACHIDLSNAGQTAVWLFASWEIPSPSTNNNHSEPSVTKNETLPIHAALFRSLYQHIYTALIPSLPISPPPSWLTLLNTGKLLSQPYSRNKVIFGTINEILLPFFPESSVTRVDPQYLKYLFAPSSPPSSLSSTAPPEGFLLGQLREEHLQTVLDRSTIPRSIETLRQLVSVGVHPVDSDEPIAWGFLGKDGSLTSLTTEPGYRGKGLAGVVGRELLRKIGSMFRNEGDGGDGGDGAGVDGKSGWGHSDVSETNIASRRVMERMGGSVGWRVAWVEVNIEEAVREVTAEAEGGKKGEKIGEGAM